MGLADSSFVSSVILESISLFTFERLPAKSVTLDLSLDTLASISCRDAIVVRSSTGIMVSGMGVGPGVGGVGEAEGCPPRVVSMFKSKGKIRNKASRRLAPSAGRCLAGAASETYASAQGLRTKSPNE